ncbi:hypothetical protein [Nostoc sp. 2RC]|nr:hypothetical protein [Nostoc sp. 2RC]MBC1238063.1 hypothetical protein [Nostoc sp. 2RC]
MDTASDLGVIPIVDDKLTFLRLFQDAMSTTGYAYSPLALCQKAYKSFG